MACRLVLVIPDIRGKLTARNDGDGTDQPQQLERLSHLALRVGLYDLAE